MSASIIAVPTAAGSAGKTTTVVSLAAILGTRGRQVLVIDGDPQATATEWLGVDPDQPRPDIGAVLLRRTSLADATIDTAAPGVRLVPASPSLDGDLIELGKVLGPEQRLRQVLAGADADIVLIDCPGAISPFTIYALVAARAVVTVTQPTMKELRGLPKLEGLIGDVADAYNDQLTLSAIVPCIVPAATAGRLYVDAMNQLQAAYNGLVTPAVRRTTRIPEAHSHSTPLPLHAPTDPATADYQAVAGWLTDRGVV